MEIIQGKTTVAEAACAFDLPPSEIEEWVDDAKRGMEGTILDMIYCELFVCMREVAAKRAPIGLSKSPPKVQDEVAKAWLKSHSEDFRLSTNDKVWDYPESLKLGLPHY